MRKKPLVLIFVFCLGLAALCRGSGEGTFSAEFLKMPPSARAAGTGHAFVSIPGGIDSILHNPAGLSFAENIEGSIYYSPYLSDTLFFSLSGAMNLNKAGVFGLSVTDLLYGDIPECIRENSGALALTGKKSEANDLLLAASYARRLPVAGFCGGATVKYILLTAAGEGKSGLALDTGVLYRKENTPWSLGVSLNNLGSGIKFREKEYPLPLILRMGGSYNYPAGPGHDLLCSFELDYPGKGGAQASLGTEYSFKRFLFLRGGYETARDLGGLNLGCGLKYGALRLDYCWKNFGALGDAHGFQLSAFFSASGRGGVKEPGLKGEPSHDEEELFEDILEEGEEKTESTRGDAPAGE